MLPTVIVVGTVVQGPEVNTRIQVITTLAVIEVIVEVDIIEGV